MKSILNSQLGRLDYWAWIVGNVVVGSQNL